MKNPRWLVPALALAVLAGLVASSYSLMPSDSQKSPSLTMGSGDTPSCCAAKPKLVSKSGCCPMAAKIARANSPACGCCGGVKAAGALESSPTFAVVSACYSAIRHSLLTTVLGVADSPKADEGPTDKKVPVALASQTSSEACQGCPEAGKSAGACGSCPAQQNSDKPQQVEKAQQERRRGKLASE